jgi:hypothetical protein
MPTKPNGRAGRRAAAPKVQQSSGQWGPGQIAAVVLVVLALIVLLFGRKLGLPSDLVSLLFERPAKVKESDWRTLSPAGGMFTVEMPGEPARDLSFTEADGPRITTMTWSVQVGADQVFLVQYADFREILKGGDSAAFLDASRESAVRAMQGKLVSEKPVVLGPVPGRDILVQGAGRAMRARMYLKDTHLYSQQIVAPRGRVTSAAAERFFASFKFRSRSDAAPPGWKEFSDRAGRFSVLLPGDPVTSEETIHTRAGNVNLYVFTLYHGSVNELYSVQYMDYPDQLMQGKTAEQLLKDAGTVDAFNMNGKVVREQALPLEQRPGREVHFETAAVAARIRLCLVERRLYKTVAMWPKSRAFSPDDERFLASFRLMP